MQLDAWDIDDTIGVDVRVYLRQSCEDEDSQVACGDDVLCETDWVSEGCAGDGRQPRHGRAGPIELPPGTYWAIVDTYEYSGFGCGNVALNIIALELPIVTLP